MAALCFKCLHLDTNPERPNNKFWTCVFCRGVFKSNTKLDKKSALVGNMDPSVDNENRKNPQNYKESTYGEIKRRHKGFEICGKKRHIKISPDSAFTPYHKVTVLTGMEPVKLPPISLFFQFIEPTKKNSENKIMLGKNYQMIQSVDQVYLGTLFSNSFK